MQAPMPPPRVGGAVKALQPWSAIQAVDMRVGRIREAMLPQDMQSKYRKIAQPVYAVWSDFGSIDAWPHSGDWGRSTNLITAAKIRSYHSVEALQSGSLQMVGLLNVGLKQVGKLQTYYLLTGCYTDERADEHNVARAEPLAAVEEGTRMTVISVRSDGARLEPLPERCGPLRETVDFVHDFEEKLDLRVGMVKAVEVDAGTWSVSVDFGDDLVLRTRVPGALQEVVASEDFVGQLVVGMVNVEPVDGNSFVMLGFVRDDGCCVPLTVHRPEAGLPPLGARVC